MRRPGPLPIPEIRAFPPQLGTPAMMIGRGRNRGPPVPGGFEWASVETRRWGRNVVGGSVNGGETATLEIATGGNRTWSLVTEFNEDGFPDEVVATIGDSGGGLFLQSPTSGQWELGGIQFALLGTTGFSLFGDDILSVDLSYYRDDILAIVRPCADGVDNDGDGAADLADGGCLWPGDVSEAPACSDGIDNDFDGAVDLGADADCDSAADLLEAPDADGDLAGPSGLACAGAPPVPEAPPPGARPPIRETLRRPYNGVSTGSQP